MFWCVTHTPFQKVRIPSVNLFTTSTQLQYNRTVLIVLKVNWIVNESLYLQPRVFPSCTRTGIEFEQPLLKFQ
jgi:hypothetical protein